MAEENKSNAKSELGQLFVDIGSSGLGTLIKGLNTVSASFLLTKNAATQFIKPIIEISQKAGRSILGLEKIRAVTGLTIDQLQELKLWANESGVDFSNFINQVSSLQQNLLDIAMGKGGNIKGFSLLGIDPRQLDYKKPLEALDEIKKRVLQLDEATGVLALKELGLSSDLLFAWDREAIAINKKLLLNKEEQDNLSKQNTLWNTLGTLTEQIFTKWISKQTWINDLLEKSVEWLNQEHPILDKISEGLKGIVKWVLLLGAAWEKVVNMIKLFHKLNNDFNDNEAPKNLTPEQKKKFEELETERKYSKLPKPLRKPAQALKKVLDLNSQILSYGQPLLINPFNLKNDPKRKMIKWAFNKINGIADKNYDEIFGHTTGTETPIPDIPPALKNGNNGTDNDILNAPPSQTGTQVNNYSITVNQDISGNDPITTAAVSADKLEDSLESWQRQFSSGL